MKNEIKAICLGFFVHFILFLAVFDIYYKSPLVHGVTPHGYISNPPAFRLVLFVADGLRAQTFFDKSTSAPFLKNVMEFNGSWGVSHSRMPTESRPGHVALTAGFYEDVSAVMKGWRENPVEFDSIFNRSSYTWSWGSPDILPMFAKGASGDHVFTETYPNHFEDFASDNASKLDVWVFDKVKIFFENARQNFTLNSMIRKEKAVFFLHLLGTDTIGHGFKPRSDEYVASVAVVDRGIREIFNLFEEFYADQRTVYVFTADHGMTDWGSHGAGHEHETATPLVVWGSGIKKPSSKSSLAISSAGDVQQIDLAPLMAALIGVDIPVNSLGVLPLSYLNASDQYKSHAACSNFDTVVEQMLKLRQMKLETSFRFLFREFSAFSLTKLDAIRRQVSKLLVQKRYTLASNVCLEWIPTAVQGLLYYHRYERIFLTIFVVLTFLSWQIYVWNLISSSTAYDKKDVISIFDPKKEKKFIFTTIFILLYLFSTSQPWMYFVYCLLPVGLLYSVRNSLNVTLGSCSTIFKGVLMAAAVEILVLTFFFRWSLICGLSLLSFWPLFKSRVDSATKKTWILACLSNCAFPLLPTVGQSVSYGVVASSGLILSGASFAWTTFHNYKTNGSEFRRTYLFTVSSVVLMCASFSVLLTAESVESKRGSPLFCRIFSWIILFSSPILPLLNEKILKFRCSSIVLAFATPFTLMSVSYEPYFLIALTLLLYLWLKIEQKLDGTSSMLNDDMEFGAETNLSINRRLEFEDFRRAYFFVFFILLAFFGTGNVASLNSFNPSFVYCFITVFSPFLMGALLIIKIIIPFLFVCMALRVLESVCPHCSANSLFWMIVMISDFMALNFFFLLKDSGSWLDIGTSISHYVISMIMTVVIMILYGLAKILTSFSLVDAKRHLL